MSTTTQPVIESGRMTEAQLQIGPHYKADHQGEYIELTVYGPSGNVRNIYTIDNDHDGFAAWCIENNHAKPEYEKEFDPDDDEAYSVNYNTEDCRKDATLVLDYCLETIKNDFPS